MRLRTKIATPYNNPSGILFYTQCYQKGLLTLEECKRLRAKAIAEKDAAVAYSRRLKERK